MSTGPLILHATTVSVAGRGLLILGPSGAGKSALALELISRGAVLVADDRTQVVVEGDTLTASVPTAIAGLIEARGVGLLRTPEALEVVGPKGFGFDDIAYRPMAADEPATGSAS